MQTWIFSFVNFDLEVNENRVLLTQKSKLSHEGIGNEHFETSKLRFPKNPMDRPWCCMLFVVLHRLRKYYYKVQEPSHKSDPPFIHTYWHRERGDDKLYYWYCIVQHMRWQSPRFRLFQLPVATWRSLEVHRNCAASSGGRATLPIGLMKWRNFQMVSLVSKPKKPA